MYKLLYSQGYDLWLTQAFLPRSDFKPSVMLLEKLKQLVEQDLLMESTVVERIKPTELRLLSLVGFGSEAVGYVDEKFVPNLYPELVEQVSQAQMRQMWHIL